MTWHYFGGNLPVVTIVGDLIVYEVAVPQFDHYGGFTGDPTVRSQLQDQQYVRFDVLASSRFGEDALFGRYAENDLPMKHEDADSFGLYKLVRNPEISWEYPLKPDFDGNFTVDLFDLDIFSDYWMITESSE